MATHKYVDQTADSLIKTADAIVESAEALRSVAHSMKTAGFDSLRTTNFDQLRRAMTYLGNYESAVKAALRKARESRGDFYASNGQKPDKKRAGK